MRYIMLILLTFSGCATMPVGEYCKTSQDTIDVSYDYCVQKETAHRERMAAAWRSLATQPKKRNRSSQVCTKRDYGYATQIDCEEN